MLISNIELCLPESSFVRPLYQDYRANVSFNCYAFLPSTNVSLQFQSCDVSFLLECSSIEFLHLHADITSHYCLLINIQHCVLLLILDALLVLVHSFNQNSTTIRVEHLYVKFIQYRCSVVFNCLLLGLQTRVQM